MQLALLRALNLMLALLSRPDTLPPPPSFSGGDRSEVNEGLPTDGSNVDANRRQQDVEVDGAERRRDKGGATRDEWRDQRDVPEEGDGDAGWRHDRRHSDDRAGDYERHSSWSTGTPSTGDGWTRQPQPEDPWTHGRDPWSRDSWKGNGRYDHGDHGGRGGRYWEIAWMDERDQGPRGHDPHGFRGAPRADGRDLGPRLHDSQGQRGGPWADGGDPGPRGHDPDGFHGAPWADGRESGYRVHDHGHLHRWNDGSDQGPHRWNDGRNQATDDWGARDARQPDQRGGWPFDNGSQCGWSTWSFDDGGRQRPTERVNVPTFSAEDTDDLGNSARSYLRQVEVWKRITRLPVSQLGLVLYQHLTGKAWIAAEELSVARLSAAEGLTYFTSWVTARFLDLEVARIGRAFSDFFRKLRRRQGQTVREYNTEYDRLHGRLREVRCSLPEECAAWLYLDRLQLEESQELNLLASVGNRYSLHHLQHAAVLHDRGQRKPWESTTPRGRKPNFAHMTDCPDDGEEDDEFENSDEVIPEEVAEAYMTFQSAKERYRAQQRSRGTTDSDRGGKGEGRDGDPKGAGGDREAKLKAMKARSFCGGCGRRGHWHKDDACPLNAKGAKPGVNPKEVAMTTVLPADVFALKHMSSNLVGVADTACARTVAGSQWLQSYSNLLSEMGQKPHLQKECEAYRFGTGRVHYSSFYVIVNFRLGNYTIQVRTSIITGDIPLLLSKTVLGKLGMVYDVEMGRADFKAINLKDYELATTSSGHPAIPIVPVCLKDGGTPDLQVEDLRLQPVAQYMSVCAVAHHGPQSPKYTRIYFEKKLDPSTRDMLSQDRLQLDTYVTWWEKTAHDRDFWVETPSTWVRVHVVPRRAMFNPSTWRTGSTVLRDMLVATLGTTRMTECVCCKTGQWIESTVDQWSHGEVDQISFPLLWIGRTVFYKIEGPRPRPSVPCAGNGSLAMSSQAADAEPHEQDPAASRSRSRWGDSAPLLDCPRTSGGDPGAHREPHREECPTENARPEFDDTPRAAQEGPGNGSGDPRQDEQGEPAPPDQKLCEHRRRQLDDDRTVEGLSVQGDPGRLWIVGAHGDREDPEFLAQVDHVRPLVEGEQAQRPQGDGDPGRRQRPGGPTTYKPGDSIIKGILGTGVKHTHKRVSWSDGQREHEAFTQEGESDRGGVPEDHDGRDGGPGGDRGDQSPGAEARPPEGQGAGIAVSGLKAEIKETAANAGGDRQCRSVGCCELVNEEDIITEEEYVRAYSDQALNYVNQHYEPGDGSHHPPLRFGDDNFDWADFSFANCQALLERSGLPRNESGMRPMQKATGNDDNQVYVNFGMFTHGGVRGLTRATKEYESVVRYLNYFAKEHLGEDAKWSSISVTRNVATGVHRDSNNHRDSMNYNVTFGQHSGGGLWLEADINEEQAKGKDVVWRKDKGGAWIPGHFHSTAKAFYAFNPFQKHASAGWTGTRWSLTYHTVRGADEVGTEIKKYLRQVSFPIGKIKTVRGPKKPGTPRPVKSMRKEIMNTAGRISVLMATLIACASSYMAENYQPGPDHDPIVMMEIGGYEGTLEATELNKAVIEPMEWGDYLNPTVQENAYRFIKGATPRELRIHLDGMPARASEAIRQLIMEQLGEGGEVVLRGGGYDEFVANFQDYVKYHNRDQRDGWVVLRGCKSDSKELAGDRRPHEVQMVTKEIEEEPKKLDGSGITFEAGVPGILQASLRRLHQNLGHPRNEDLCRHLKLAGCEAQVTKAVKGMRCTVCDATKHAQVARPTAMPRLLDFNSCVGIDIFYIHDMEDKRHAFLTMVDWATTYQVVARLEHEAGPDVEKAFNTHWVSPFGPPTTVSLDLDGKVQ